MEGTTLDPFFVELCVSRSLTPVIGFEDHPETDPRRAVSLDDAAQLGWEREEFGRNFPAEGLPRELSLPPALTRASSYVLHAIASQVALNEMVTFVEAVRVEGARKSAEEEEQVREEREGGGGEKNPAFVQIRTGTL